MKRGFRVDLVCRQACRKHQRWHLRAHGSKRAQFAIATVFDGGGPSFELHDAPALGSVRNLLSRA